MKKLLCLLACLLLLTGCAAHVELNMMAVCLGVDAGEAGVGLTVRAPDYTGSPQEGQDGYLTLSADGATWEQAVDALYAQAPAALQFGQLREVAVSRAAFERMPPERLLRLIDQLPGIRSHALVTVCPGAAREYVGAMKPKVGKRLSKYLDITLAHAETEGRIPATSLSCAVRDLSGHWRDPILAWTAGGGYALGTAAGGQLTGSQVQLFRLIRGEKQNYRLLWQGRACGVSPRGAAQLTVETENGQDTLRLYLPVTLTYSVYEDPPAPGAEEALRGEVEELLKALQAFGCDALGFGCQAVRGYATLPEWLNSDWPRRYRQAAARVELDVLLRQEAER